MWRGAQKFTPFLSQAAQRAARPQATLMTRPMAIRLAGAGGMGLSCFVVESLCEDKKDGGDTSTMSASIAELFNDPKALQAKLLAGGTTLTFGGAMGFASGMAAKKVGKVLVVVVGGIFAIFQLAANAGYVTIEWEAVERDFEKVMDLDGDGKLDQNDGLVAFKKANELLTHNMATSAGGFTAGFLYGLRKG